MWNYYHPQKDEETKADIFRVGKYTMPIWFPKQKREIKWLVRVNDWSSVSPSGTNWPQKGLQAKAKD